MKTLAQWLNKGRIAGIFFQNTKVLKLKDGNTISVQASKNHYCEPRVNSDSYELYESFEVGFPSKHYDALEEYKDGSCDQVDSVFGWVPKDVIEKIISDAGGVVGFHSWED